MQTTLVCSLLDIVSLPITQAFLEDIGFLKEAYSLEHAILYQPTKGYWKTIHPRWDEEMLSYLYNESEGWDLVENKKYLNAALDSIFNLKEEKRAYLIIGTIYDIAARRVISIELAESVTQIQSYFTDRQKSELYTFYIAFAYVRLEKYNEAIECFDMAININPNYAVAWLNKGTTLGDLGKHNEAIECFDMAININPNYADVWFNKGIALGDLGKHNEAIECYDIAIKIDANYADVWFNKGIALGNLGKYNEAIECCDMAIKIDANYAAAWFNKGIAFHRLGEYDEPIECYDMAININPNYAVAWLNKGNALRDLGKHNEAIECFEKAININPDAWFNKGIDFHKLGKYMKFSFETS